MLHLGVCEFIDRKHLSRWSSRGETLASRRKRTQGMDKNLIDGGQINKLHLSYLIIRNEKMVLGQRKEEEEKMTREQKRLTSLPCCPGSCRNSAVS